MTRSRNPRRQGETKAAAPTAPAQAAAPDGEPLDLTLGTVLVAALLLIPPFLVDPAAKESFRVPKLYASGWLALASLLVLAWGLRRVPRFGLADLRRLPALSAVLPLVALATLSLATSRHPFQVREGLLDLWIGAAALVGWSAALGSARLERLLAASLLPAGLLALVGALQYHDLWQPLSFLGLKPGERLALTSFAGNPGDLGAYLVLPVLIAQRELFRRLRSGAWRSLMEKAALGAVALLGALCAYGLVLTQTLAALAALAVGSLLFWAGVLPRKRLLLLLAAGAALALAVGLGVAPLRERIALQLGQLRAGSLNQVLSGRLDGWRAALWMVEQRPLAGVGHGAYRPEFIPAKIALLDRGRPFSEEQMEPVFANAHSEPLEVAADLGVPGIAALAWGLWVVARRLRRTGPAAPAARDDGRALAWGGCAALFVLGLAYFPFRVALVAFPALLFLAWALRPVEEALP